ncbi:urate hydroxylase PuuD [Staphylococcus epidermidis]|nr:urate hydroxylase PuuD [Staphylococcus epidermidis]
MESYILDWANLLLRWLHVITAIAWVGSFLLLRVSGQQQPDAACR